MRHSWSCGIDGLRKERESLLPVSSAVAFLRPVMGLAEFIVRHAVHDGRDIVRAAREQMRSQGAQRHRNGEREMSSLHRPTSPRFQRPEGNPQKENRVVCH